MWHTRVVTGVQFKPDKGTVTQMMYSCNNDFYFLIENLRGRLTDQLCPLWY